MANARNVIVTYVLFFMGVGVTLPFLPVYYAWLHIPPEQIGVLLSVGPLGALVAPPFWGQLADRTGRPGFILFVISLGSLTGFGLLLAANRFETVLGCLVVFSFFNAATTTLIDSLALGHVERHGGSFASLRTAGSVGFVISTLVFGFAVDRADRRVVIAALALAALNAAFIGVTLGRAPAHRRSGPTPDLRGVRAVLAQPQVRWLLLASATHWIASAPYHGSVGLYFDSLHLAPWVLSLSSSVGVASEIVVLATWPRWSHRVAPRTLLLVTFAVSGLRWFAMGSTSSVPVLLGLAVLHGLSFGAFYVASITWVAERAPASLRASGQALFVAATFGLGGLVGFTGSGWLYGHLGGAALFRWAGLAELVPFAVASLFLVNRPVSQAAPVHEYQ